MAVPEINTVILLDREVIPTCTFTFLIVCPFKVLLLHLFGFNTDDGMLWMQVDMVTPLCSQLTYEGLIDEAS